MRKNPSYTIARINHTKIAIPNPLILSSLDSAILYEIAVKMKVSSTPITSRVKKLIIYPEFNSPYNKNGIPNPKMRLDDSAKDNPRYCPRKIVFLVNGCANNSLLNSIEL